MAHAGAVIYARASKDKTGAGLSVTGQEADCRALAAGRNLAVREVFTDNDISASGKKRRPGYQALLAYLAGHPATTVVVWHTDRLHRHPGELEEYIALAEAHGITTHAARVGELDLATPSGRLVARMLGAAARHELEIMSQRRRDAKARAAAAGTWKGGRRPFGYSADGVTVVRAEAALIAAGTEAILQGATLSAVTRAWNASGIATSTGRPWLPREVSRVLRRPRNAGLMEHQGHVLAGVRAQWPAIVDEPLWRGAAAVLSDPVRRTSPGPERQWLLSGIAECGVCGRGLVVAVAGGKGRPLRPVYRCRPARGSGSLGHLARDVASLDEYVTTAVLAWLARPDAALALRPAARNAAPLHTQVAALRQRLDQVAGMFADGAIDASQLAAATRKLNAELAAVNHRLAELGRHDNLAAFRGHDPAAVWARLDLHQRRAVITTLMRLVLKPAPRGRPRGWKPGQPYFDPNAVDIHWHQ